MVTYAVAIGGVLVVGLFALLLLDNLFGILLATISAIGVGLAVDLALDHRRHAHRVREFYGRHGS